MRRDNEIRWLFNIVIESRYLSSKYFHQYYFKFSKYLDKSSCAQLFFHDQFFNNKPIIRFSIVIFLSRVTEYNIQNVSSRSLEKIQNLRRWKFEIPWSLRGDPTRLFKKRKKEKRNRVGRRYRKRFVAVLSLPSLSFRWICKFSDDKPLDGTGSRLHFPSNIASFDVIIARALLTLGHIDKHVSLEIEGYERVEGKRRWLRNWWSEIVICGGENDGWKKVDRTNIICFSRGNVSKIWLWRSSLSPWLLLFCQFQRWESFVRIFNEKFFYVYNLEQCLFQEFT